MSQVTIVSQVVQPCTYSYRQRCLKTQRVVTHTRTYQQRVAILQQHNQRVVVLDFQPSKFRSQKALQSLFPIALHYAKMGVAGYAVG
jgi:hypothetical protein